MVVTAPAAFLPRARLDDLIAVLIEDGRTVIGPTIVDGVISYDEIRSAEDLPLGWRDEQGPGSYGLVRPPGEPDRVFDFTVGPGTWKGSTFPARVPIGRARTVDGAAVFEDVTPDARQLAFLGVRGCELAALAIQDRVLRDGPVSDPDYAARRAAALVIAVECTVAGATCFCTSMGTGPEVDEQRAELVLTEIDDGFLVRVGSEAGRALVERLALDEATETQAGSARVAVAAVRERIGDPVNTDGLRGRLLGRLEDPRWAEVAERCLACANCTLVCPTCFCTSVSQRSDLDTLDTIAERSWDSCFSGDFAKVAGGNFRARRQDRYRQWLTHKFATWLDQFGSFGCVGCGRCITWCPVGIDIREELLAIARPPARRPLPVAAAASPGRYVTACVAATATETLDTTTLRIEGVDPAIANGRPGQFVMVTRPGLPAVPISISRYHPDENAIELSIRAAGPATETLTGLTQGAMVGLRGPLGRGWPMETAEGRDLIVVAGGIGLSPLRPSIDAVLTEPSLYGVLRIYHGARTPADRPHVEDQVAWAASGVELGVIVDRADGTWRGPVGVVTNLFDGARWEGREAVAFVCGPERMMQATVATLLDRGLRPGRIFVSLERHMECGIGLCGHCQLGKYFVCRDGPVFSFAELGDAFLVEGL